jgi:hypothetical protein
VTYALFKNVSDLSVLEVTAQACRSNLDSGETHGESNASGIDTYDNLLYKLGKYGQAIEWEDEG